MAPNCSTLELPQYRGDGPNSDSQAALESYGGQEREAELLREEISRLHERLAMVENQVSQDQIVDNSSILGSAKY